MKVSQGHDKSTLELEDRPIELRTKGRASFTTHVLANERHRSSTRWMVSLCSILLFAVVILVPARAQQPSHTAIATSVDLPEAPQAQLGQQSAPRTEQTEGPGTISGVVLDLSGARVVGAQVTLNLVNGVQVRTVLSKEDGVFVFTAVPTGSYVVVIDANGLEPFTSAAIVLAPGQAYDVPRKLLAIASANTSVEVRPAEVVAAEQIRAEEKQRLFGVVPDFYTSYVYDAAPMTSKQKCTLAFRDTFDPARIVGSGVAAGIQQATNSFAGYGQGAAGYGKRFAAVYGDGLTSDLLSHAVLPSLLHQDPRYFYQGSGTTKSRLIHAISFAVVVRNDSGGITPNYSYLGGDIGSGLLSNLYYPHANRGVGLVFTNALIGIGGRAAGNIVREFFAKQVTTNVPANGKP